MTYKTETRTVYITEDGIEHSSEHLAKQWQCLKEIGPIIERYLSDVTILEVRANIENNQEFRNTLRAWLNLYDEPQAPKADADGWIEWNGGSRPVSPETTVEVRFRDGAKDKSKAINWYWPHDTQHERGHIVAYRVISD